MCICLYTCSEEKHVLLPFVTSLLERNFNLMSTHLMTLENRALGDIDQHH